MKRNIYVALIGLVLLSFGCSHEIEKSLVENYTPPTVKEQPKLFYPVVAQENSVYGKTKASLRISKDGKVARVFIYKSSGSPILDQAVDSYCKKLIFNPAQKDGQPIESRILWEVNFDFVNEAYSNNEYLKNIDGYYDLANRSVATERMSLLKYAIERHLRFIDKNSDAMNFNQIISKFISSKLVAEWGSDWNTYPLSFLIFHDFMKRFSDYDSIGYVKSVMFNALKNDLNYIKNYSTTPSRQEEKERLIQKIKKFIADNYPGQSVVLSRKKLINDSL